MSPNNHPLIVSSLADYAAPPAVTVRPAVARPTQACSARGASPLPRLLTGCGELRGGGLEQRVRPAERATRGTAATALQGRGRAALYAAAAAGPPAP